MGEAAGGLTGPDLAQGITASEIPDGGMILGHAHGEPVIVARRDDEVFAVGATCTHYSGPLAEGLIVGDTLRCPWHHACYSLRTGEALRAPALNPIPCYMVWRDGEKVTVGEKTELLKPDKKPTPPSQIVIVGGGAAGEAAAEMLRRRGYVGRLTLVSADESLPVDRPNLSKDYLAGTAPEEWMPLRGREFFEQQGIELELGHRVEKIDPAAKVVTLADGRTRAYDALLLATGADPVRLPIPGADLPHVHTLRTLADSRAIIAKVPHTVRAVVVGASFIGLEVAASLRARNVDVHVVAPESTPLERVLGAEVGKFLKKLHEDKGVVFHLGLTPAAVDAAAVTLSNGEKLTADLVVLGVGVRPTVALAEQAGLKLDRGVVVDEQLRTSAPGIWAAGDMAKWPDPHSGADVRVEHWVVAQRMGQCAAKNMLGEGIKFTDVPFFWSAHYDVTIRYVGHAEKFDEAVVEGSLEGRDAKVSYKLGGKTLAVATISRDRESLEVEAAMESAAAPTK